MVVDRLTREIRYGEDKTFEIFLYMSVCDFSISSLESDVLLQEEPRLTGLAAEVLGRDPKP